VRWYWDFGDGSNSLSQFVTHQFQSSMRWDPLRVCLIVTDSVGCEDTVCRQFLLHPDIEVTIPEGFSPNDDGDNDVLTISNAWAFPRADWSVFNRWGQVVYLSNDTQRNHWDGRCNTPGCNGDRLPEGVYYLVFQYNDGKRKNLSRNVYLKR
jgi:gliding motility-associated-like protein